MAAAFVGDDLARSVSSRSSWRSQSRSQSIREVWQGPPDVFMRGSRQSQVVDDEEELKWAAIERLPTYDRMRKGMLMQNMSNGRVVRNEVDVTNLGAQDKQQLMESILKVVEEDNERFLQRLRNRTDRVGIETPKIEALLGTIGLSPSKKRIIKILKDVSGIIKPSRLTLLLGPPGSGKTTFLQALSASSDDNLKINGKITYCGHEFKEFVPQRTCAYISQNDLHYGEMTVRETLDFSGRCLGVGTRYEMLAELSRREKEAGIKPDPEIDAFMKATAMVGQETREMLVGPAKAFFMDEISTGLDSSTTFQITKFMRQMVHIMDVTMVISLLQPAPETFELFDNVILLSDGQIVYQGPRENILEFFEYLGFKCPDRKGIADFLQEVTSKKDQEQYWFKKNQPYRYVSVPDFSRAFNSFHVGQHIIEDLRVPYDKSRAHPAALVKEKYGISNKELFRACFSREWLLMKRNSFVYVFKTTQITIMAIIALTVFLRTEMKTGQIPDAAKFWGALFFSLVNVMFNGMAELAMTVFRLPVFFKQRDSLFFPAWAFALPISVLRIPISLMESDDIKSYMIWGYYVSPMMYGQNAIAINEFLSERWSTPMPNGSAQPTVGKTLLKERGLFVDEYWYWICIGALFGFSVLFNILFILALTYLNPLGKSKAEMKTQGVDETRLQLLRDVSGAFRPGILTALVGVSGAGKTTLMDVLAGRKTGGYIEGSITISGFPKNQQTFARVSGYCEQNDIHSPYVTVYESLLYSAWLRLPADVKTDTRKMFVEEVMDLVELNPLRNALVGLPGVDGLSTEQRKRLTIAVELVANPSIIFMDEPTSGLDARAAAIVMRTVRNTVDTGRTVVCTIHQPSIDIFEAFDELLLMKRGGQVIYGGSLGRQSHKLVEYFEAIPGVPKIKEGYNPATWMLEVSSPAAEVQHNVDFAEIYANSDLNRHNQELIKELSTPAPNSKDLYFPTQYSQPFLTQCKATFWKQHWSYWRNSQYNAIRMFMTLVIGGMFGMIFWGKGDQLNRQQDLLNLLGATYAAILFLGAGNASSVQSVVAIERTVFYRERAAGMYSELPYAFSQVAIETIYVAIQTFAYSLILYSMIGFQWKVEKFLYFYYFVFMCFTYFSMYGMMVVALTPGHQIAAIVMSFFLSFWNLFSGFLVPRPLIPIWWRWYYWGSPVAWTIYGIFGSQVGDIKTNLTTSEGTTMPVNVFVKEYLGYDHDFLIPVVVAHVGWVLLFFFVFAYGIKFLNFQRR
ncbi:hypothetical protein RJ640_009653 [Escallonia rubra]|uniref:ABC transporter domain-containing protein n=1 Tax=Escallonia rubra TaxID=112253 RepID=A0AA88UTV7_9ASTE|nr:hypothetical protein RJ640_009653 [Escallonia rubra]